MVKHTIPTVKGSRESMKSRWRDKTVDVEAIFYNLWLYKTVGPGIVTIAHLSGLTHRIASHLCEHRTILISQIYRIIHSHSRAISSMSFRHFHIFVALSRYGHPSVSRRVSLYSSNQRFYPSYEKREGWEFPMRKHPRESCSVRCSPSIRGTSWLLERVI